MKCDTKEKYLAKQKKRKETRRRKSHFECVTYNGRWELVPNGCSHHPKDLALNRIGDGIKADHHKRSVDIRTCYEATRKSAVNPDGALPVGHRVWRIAKNSRSRKS